MQREVAVDRAWRNQARQCGNLKINLVRTRVGITTRDALPHFCLEPHARTRNRRMFVVVRGSTVINRFASIERRRQGLCLPTNSFTWRMRNECSAAMRSTTHEGNRICVQVNRR